MKVIPAIDIMGGNCVRLSQGDYAKKKVYNTDPVEVAKMFEDWGVSRLHLVDLDGAREGRIINFGILESICNNTGLSVDFGGGVKSDKDIRIAFNSGASMVTGGSIAVADPGLFLGWLEAYGTERIILGADHRNGKIAVSGWTSDSDLNLRDLLKDYTKKGISKTICTDISVDGMLSGPSTQLYRELMKEFPGLLIIASGGVGNVSHLRELAASGIKEVIVGKALYEGKILKNELVEFLN